MSVRMLIKNILAAAICLSLMAGGAALAQEWWVSTAGNDANPGLAASPWQSLQHAVDHVVPGDTIRVLGGTYAGFRAETSGSETAWITLMAEPGQTVVIDRPGALNKHRSNLELETWEGAPVSYWRVEGLTVQNAPMWGIDVRGSSTGHAHHVSIVGNTVADNGQTGIFTAFTDYVLVEGNTASGNREHGVYLSNSGDNPTVSDNTVYGNFASGVQLNADASMGGDGIISSATITGNTIYDNGDGGGAAINLDGVVSSLIQGNNLYDNHAGGVALFQGDGAVASRDNQLVDNTIAMAADGRWAVNLTDVECVNTTIRGNIISHAGSRKGALRLPTPYLSGLVSDFNTLTGRFSVDGGDSIIDLSSWRAYGFDLHSTVLD